MTVSIKHHFTHAENMEQIEFKRIATSILADLTLLRDEVVLVGTTLADYKAIYDAHTHAQEDGDNAQSSLPDTTAGGVAAGAASAFTDDSTAIGELDLID